jgi:hypothetical protein
MGTTVIWAQFGGAVVSSEATVAHACTVDTTPVVTTTNASFLVARFTHEASRASTFHRRVVADTMARAAFWAIKSRAISVGEPAVAYTVCRPVFFAARTMSTAHWCSWARLFYLLDFGTSFTTPTGFAFATQLGAYTIASALQPLYYWAFLFVASVATPGCFAHTGAVHTPPVPVAIHWIA